MFTFSLLRFYSKIQKNSFSPISCFLERIHFVIRPLVKFFFFKKYSHFIASHSPIFQHSHFQSSDTLSDFSSKLPDLLLPSPFLFKISIFIPSLSRFLQKNIQFYQPLGFTLPKISHFPYLPRRFSSNILNFLLPSSRKFFKVPPFFYLR